MENDHVFLHIMTDLKNSRSNLAANFQNAIAVHLLPPIGVFWDIENIQVPKGKSGGAIVNSIRSRFFKRCREAEFMCVCDINKEIKSIIHELNDAQVTVVHVDATSKNAADEKLKQCMRRFVDTHGSPATLILISDDVNFAGDLSDFRHRHCIRIILIHRNHAPEALLACAHEHHNFSELMVDIPPRSPQKALNNRPQDLVVTDLPLNTTTANIKKCLRRLSDNCGGKVAKVTKSKAIISFANADSAERAQKRMDNQSVYGQKVTVNFLQPNTKEFKEFILQRKLNRENTRSGRSGSSRSASSRDSSPVCNNRDDCTSASNNSVKSIKMFSFPPAPVLNFDNMPNILKSPQKLNQTSADRSPLLPMNYQEPPRFPNFISKTVAKDEKSYLNQMHDSFIQAKCVDCSGTFQQSNQMRINSASSEEFSGNISMYRNTRLPLDSYNNGSISQPRPRPIQNLNIFAKVNNSSSSSFLHGNCNKAAYSFQQGAKSDQNGPEYSNPVELFVTNLDHTIEINELRKILLSVFREHVMVVHITMLLQPDGNPKAVVKVPSIQDAQYAISRLHRQKIGHKRIVISYVANDRTPPFPVLKSEVVSLLKDIPSKQLPLFKFREMYETRYNRAISVSEMYKMRDILTIQEDVSGRMVCLGSERSSSSCTDFETSQSQDFTLLEKPYCELHFRPLVYQGWAEQQSMPPLPDVFMSLKTLGPAVHTLLDSHQGSLPLNSFSACYEADVGPLHVINSGSDDFFSSNEMTASRENIILLPLVKGVPLEHLISCIAGVEIVKSRLCIKKVQWCENSPSNQPVSVLRSISPALAGHLAVFGREMVDLLKNQSRCVVVFNKFIPVYHHHFGRQCRVADYGFTKLIDLLEAIPHIIQVLGEGQNRLVTLTHRMQVKRFVSDLLRVLKSRAAKQLTLSELAAQYKETIERDFEITNYGVCDVEDILSEVSEASVVVTKTDDEVILAIPKREQTAEEIERTKKFALDVIELLQYSPTCSMPFNRFIPSYHQHFGRQCRVADFGFTKLIELFEAVPIATVVGSGEDKVIYLAEKERDEILIDRLSDILKLQPDRMMMIKLIENAYAAKHGYSLHAEDFGACDLDELLRKFDHVFKVFRSYSGAVVALVDSAFIQTACDRIVHLLMEQEDGQLAIEVANHIYKMRYGFCINVLIFQSEIEYAVEITSTTASLNALYMLGRNVILLLQDKKLPVSLADLGAMFLDAFGTLLRPSLYNLPNMALLLNSFRNFFVLMKKRKKTSVILHQDIRASPLPNDLLTRVLRKLSPASTGQQVCVDGTENVSAANQSFPLNQCSSVMKSSQAKDDTTSDISSIELQSTSGITNGGCQQPPRSGASSVPVPTSQLPSPCKRMAKDAPSSSSINSQDEDSKSPKPSSILGLNYHKPASVRIAALFSNPIQQQK